MKTKFPNKPGPKAGVSAKRNATTSRTERNGKAASKAHAKMIPVAKNLADLKLALDDARRLLAERGITPETISDHGFVSDKRAAYHEVIARIREIVRTSLPTNSTVAVVNKGDSELLKLEGRTGWHFPRNADGSYSGHYPATSADAIEHLEAARAQGARYLLFPSTAFWWLEFYSEFKAHLERQYPVLTREEDTCVIFALDERMASLPAQSTGQAVPNDEALAACEEDDTTVRVELAKALTRLGKENEARRILEDGLHLNPGNASLHIALMNRAMAIGNKVAVAHHAGVALSLAPDDYAINMALAKAAWSGNQLEAVEKRLVHLVTRFPLDGVALNELLNLYCNQVDAKEVDAALLGRFMAQLQVAGRAQRITPQTHLRIAEALGGKHLAEPALASLEAALGRLDFTSDALRDFTARHLRSIVADKSGIPFGDKLSLAAFLTHAGNGFSAVRDHFKSLACYRLAIAADHRSWNSASWAARVNLAFHCMAQGDAATALQHLAKATRLYPDETARIVWPTQEGVAWPHARFDLSDAFGKLKPAGAPWPKITVITPSFNQASYVGETLLSVLNQNYPNLEYFVIDGGSTDGSVEVLRPYEPRLTKLIIEKDEGQTDAINKGLRLSSGDLILWINSDDLLGPGSLFLIALAWLEEKADIIAGFCCEHSDGRFGLINLPAASQRTFNVECLGDIFHYWLKGHYFYQPEVAFSRRIFEKAGASLDKTLHYAMDYEFWLRCAAAGARMSVVHWPIGLFRKHEAQKTSRLDDTIIEQASVRDRFVIPQPGFERRLQIRSRLDRAFASAAPRVSVVSTRAAKIFSPDTARELQAAFAADGMRVTFHSDFEQLRPGESDLVIVLMHIFKEHEALRKLREAGHDGPIVGWFWDNHHHPFDNYGSASDLDVCIPGHAFAASYLRSNRYLMVGAIPLCVTQWSGTEADAFFQKHGHGGRSDALYGGFVRYAFAAKRNKLVEQLVAQGMEGVYFIEEDALDRYFGKSLEQRFAEWASHKVSICLPLAGDLSQRLFDALLAGQVPIVPPDIYDLDCVIPPAVQEQLPVVRFSRYASDAVREAHENAIDLFNSEGEAGVLRRHRYALGHTFKPRIRSILSILRDLVRDS